MKPTEPGYYWYHDSCSKRPRVLRIGLHGGKLKAFDYSGSGGFYLNSLPETGWSEAIPVLPECHGLTEKKTEKKTKQ